MDFLDTDGELSLSLDSFPDGTATASVAFHFSAEEVAAFRAALIRFLALPPVVVDPPVVVIPPLPPVDPPVILPPVPVDPGTPPLPPVVVDPPPVVVIPPVVVDPPPLPPIVPPPVVIPIPPPPIVSVESPTGRNPRIFWSPRWQAIAARMMAESHPWWKLIKLRADATGTTSESYNDLGEWAALAYQTTGDKTYAARAIAKCLAVITQDPSAPGLGPNYVRENFLMYGYLYDWLLPALSADQKAAWIEGLNRWCEWTLAINTAQYKGGFRVTDSDQTIGQFMGLALVDLLTGPDNPKAGTWLTQTARNLPSVPVGGLTPTGSNFLSARNAIRRFCELAHGGIWPESSEYNTDTPRLMLLGTQAIQALTGVDYFPEFTSLLPDYARGLIADLTPDLADSYQWGDDENPHAFRDRLFHRVTTLGMLAGLLQDQPIGRTVQGLLQDMAARWGWTTYHSIEPWPRLFFFYDPYAPADPSWKASAPRVHFAAGMGQLKVHDGWNDTDAFFAARFGKRSGIDHETADFGDLDLYWDREWVLTSPIGYGTIADTNAASNSLLVAGLSSMLNRDVTGWLAAPDASWFAIAGTTKGGLYPQPHYQNPAEFLHDWTRQVVYLPAADVHTIVVLDYVDAENPLQLASPQGYAAPDLARIKAAPSLLQWLIHSPIAPTLMGDSLQWKTPRGKLVNVQTLRPQQVARQTVSEAELWAAVHDFHATELKFQTAISPVGSNRPERFLHVLSFSRGAVPATGLEVLTPGNPGQIAVTIARPGLPDRTLTFGPTLQDLLVS